MREGVSYQQVTYLDFWPIIMMKSLNAVKLIKLYNASKFKGLDFIMGQKNLCMEPVV